MHERGTIRHNHLSRMLACWPLATTQLKTRLETNHRVVDCRSQFLRHQSSVIFEQVVESVDQEGTAYCVVSRAVALASNASRKPIFCGRVIIAWA